MYMVIFRRTVYFLKNIKHLSIKVFFHLCPCLPERSTEQRGNEETRHTRSISKHTHDHSRDDLQFKESASNMFHYFNFFSAENTIK